jgi:predicted NACHT family NTPase
LNYLHEWRLIDSTWEDERLRESVNEFFSNLTEEWQAATDARKRKHGIEVDSEPISLPHRERFVDQLKNLIQQRHTFLSSFEQKLQKLKRTVASPEFQGVSAFGHEDYRNACYLNECARAAPEGVFSYSNATLIVSFSQDILEEWGGPLLIVGAPGFGKTSFCRWHALLDAKQYNIGQSNTLPVYVPLHQFSRKKIGTFQETFLQRLGQSGLITNRDQTSPSRVRVYLDGLDEVAVPERRKELVDLAKIGADQNSNYQIVITSRDYIYGDWIDWAPKIYLSEFNDLEVREFIDKKQ